MLWAHSCFVGSRGGGGFLGGEGRALELRRKARALMIVCGCNLFEWGTFLRRLDNFLMDLYEEPSCVEALLEALMERHLAGLERVCSAIGDVCDILRFGDDLGMDTGPFMPPEMYRKFFKSRHARLCEYVHSHSGMRTYLHCGSIHALLPDLIDAVGLISSADQLSRHGTGRLKREFAPTCLGWRLRHPYDLNRGKPPGSEETCEKKAQILNRRRSYLTIHNILPGGPGRGASRLDHGKAFLIGR